MKIGIFDSGIGGLSVLHQALKYLPKEQYIYYADEANVPYGEKTKDQIIGFVDEAVAFLIKQGAEAIVIACNTATSAAINEMRAKYQLPIIGMEPAIKRALDLYGEHRVLAAATPITVKGEKMRCLMERVDQQHLVDLIPLPKLVRWAENSQFESEEITSYLQEHLEAFPLSEYSSFVLGCTHFNYFKKSIRALLPENIHFVDGNEGTIHQLIHETGLHMSEEYEQPYNNQQSIIEYYASGIRVESPEELERIESYLEWLEQMLVIE